MQSERVFTVPVVATIVAIYAISALILLLSVGPWESVRQTIVGGLLLLAWIGAAKWILGAEPVPELLQIKRPGLELLVVFASLVVMMTLAALNYLNVARLPTWFYIFMSAGVVVILHLVQRYPPQGWGLRWPSRRGWLALLVIILLNVSSAILFIFVLPPGEGVTPQGADLSEGINGPLGAVMLLITILLSAALPEEMVLRFGILPRLTKFVGLGFAIVVTALLFSSGHLPQQMIRDGRSFPLAAAYLLSIENGMIAGYLWYRTRSLPLLLLLHLFAFPRFGV